LKNKTILLIKKFLYYNFNLFYKREEHVYKELGGFDDSVEEHFEDSLVVVGIIKERWFNHRFYIMACKELKISYKVIDLFSQKWLECIEESNLDFLVVRPSVQYTPWKDMFDNRVRLIESLNGIKIFPNTESLWIWESKLRTIEWLKVNKIPHAKTEIFYDLNELKRFSNNCSFPLVYKSSIGSGSSGVKLIYNKRQLKKISNRVFNRGIRTYRKNKLDKEHGFIILQEYLNDVKEWRIIRIGEYYFGYEKLKDGQFHSGSQNFGYGIPPKKCLNLVKKITDVHNFKYVDIDVFITKEGSFLVNEIQPYFGQKDDRELLQIEEESGRLTYNENTKNWDFEKGDFCKNNLCNLRILEMIKTLDK
jgi:glutathione synthase/RimK-type ligase-like ATP-grasp enzyme